MELRRLRSWLSDGILAGFRQGAVRPVADTSGETPVFDMIIANTVAPLASPAPLYRVHTVLTAA